VIGIAGILVDQAFEPSEVMITDLEDHLELIRSNVLRNPCKTVKVSQYDWCHPPELGTYDIVLAFEWLLSPPVSSPSPSLSYLYRLLSVYREELYEPLIQSLKLLCHKESIILLGLTRSFAKPSFFSVMRSHGLNYSMIPMEALPQTYYSETAGSNVGLFVCTLA
jgi:hypothetical protein